MNFSCVSFKINKELTYSREVLKQKTFDYFWKLASTTNYQIPDRYPTLTFSSIAATGFGLSSYIAGVEYKFVSREKAAERVVNTLEYLWKLPQGDAKTNVSGYKGFFYHFLNLHDATRFKDVELSSIDTGLLMAGVLSVQSYFDQPEATEKRIRQLADSLYLRVDWQWMMNEHAHMSMGWRPEHGFINSEWKGYNEAMVLLIMAIGSPTHNISTDAWQAWCDSYDWDEYQNETYIQFDPLFGHQYSHIWIDFKGIQDSYTASKEIDYFENSKRATRANRKYCISNPQGNIGYGENCWGLTACDGPYNGKKMINGKVKEFFDYRARGADKNNVVDDGTIAPTAAGGSMPFLPIESEAALKYMWETYNKDLIGEFGFKDAFNPTYTDMLHPNGWFDIDYLGIDQGPILLQMANHETGIIWKTMKKNPYIVSGLKKAGFKNGWLEHNE